MLIHIIKERVTEDGKIKWIEYGYRSAFSFSQDKTDNVIEFRIGKDVAVSQAAAQFGFDGTLNDVDIK